MADNPLIGQKLGQYQIVSLIGRGGMASVFRAQQLNIERDVAIKVIRGDLVGQQNFIERFEREAKLIAPLRHPHILKLFDYGQQGDMVYLVMEYMTGGTLADLIQRGSVPLSLIQRMINQLCSALEYAHERNIVHRDLKPQNVLLDEQQNATLSDFGIARMLADNLRLTQTGTTMGTPFYMAPEQWQEGRVDQRVDIYALGVILYEMLTGDPPFMGETTHGVMYKHLMELPPPIESRNNKLPPSINAVIQQALAKDPALRYEHVAYLAEDFNKALSGMAELGTTYSLPSSRPIKRGEDPAPLTNAQPVVPNPTMGSRATRSVPPQQERSAGDSGSIPLAALYQNQNEQGETRTSARSRRNSQMSRSTLLVGGIGALALIVLLALIFASGGRVEQPSQTPGAGGEGTEIAATGTPTVTGTAVALITDPKVPAGLGIERLDSRSVVQVGVPAGCFTMGSDSAVDSSANASEQPDHEVCLVSSYWLDRTEVTNAAYKAFMDSGGYTNRELWSEAGWAWLQKSGVTGPEDRSGLTAPDQPRLGVNWYEAEAYARWRGARLPTEAEWEYAARGPMGYIYAWGNAYQNGQAHINEITRGGKSPTSSAPVGSFLLKDKSWVGALDLTGNVCEWTADWYDPEYYAKSERDNPLGPETGDRKTIRGGSWVSSPTTSRAAFRAGHAPDTRPLNCGFRVVSESAQPVVNNAPLKFTLLHTNDTQSNHMPQNDGTGGDARMATVINRVRGEVQNSLLVDVGGRLSGTLFHRVFAGQNNVQIMTALGYQAMGIGNREFDNGDALLAQFIDSVKFPLISANINASKSQVLAGKITPYLIIRVGGQPVGITGVTIADTPRLSSPSANVAFDSNYANQINRQVIAMRALGVNKIIVLANIGYEQSVNLAAELSGVAVIVAGRDNILLSNIDPNAVGKYPNQVLDKDGKPILVVIAGGTDARYIGRLNMEFAADGSLLKWDGDTILLDQSIPADKDIESLINGMNEQVELERNRIIRDNNNAEITVESEIPLVDCRTNECVIGNLVADAMRDRAGTQIALMNAGGVRAGFGAGKLLRGTILEILPFSNRLSRFQISGEALWSALENGVSRVGADSGTGRFPQISGIRFTYDPTKEAGSRIVSIDVLGADGMSYTPLDRAATYTIATNDFLRRGGDGYDAFAKAQEVEELDLFLDEVLTQYLQKIGKVNPQLEGRIVVENPPAP